jgi:hypothetical protein
VPGYLQNERAIPAFMQKGSFRRLLDGQATKNERPRRESKILTGAFSPKPNALDGFGLPEPSLRYDEIGIPIRQIAPDVLKADGCRDSCHE